ncbi:hypothetical protein MTO96_052332 [Rhipicephalus appendiculatus]
MTTYRLMLMAMTVKMDAPVLKKRLTPYATHRPSLYTQPAFQKTVAASGVLRCRKEKIGEAEVQDERRGRVLEKLRRPQQRSDGDRVGQHAEDGHEDESHKSTGENVSRVVFKT